MANEPKMYQKLKFFGIGYSETCFLYAFITGKRFSIQPNSASIMPPPRQHPLKSCCHLRIDKVGSLSSMVQERQQIHVPPYQI